MVVEEIQRKARVALLRGGLQVLQDVGEREVVSFQDHARYLLAVPDDLDTDVKTSAVAELQDSSWANGTVELLIRYKVVQVLFAEFAEVDRRRLMFYVATGRGKELLDRCACGDEKPLAWFVLPVTARPPSVGWEPFKGSFNKSMLRPVATQADMNAWYEKVKKTENPPLAPLARTLGRLNALVSRRGRSPR